MEVRKKEWETYEELAAEIYKKIDPDATVKHNDSLYGYDSEDYRQIDVSIRKTVGSHEILVIVQVRLHKRAPDVNSIGELVAVIKDVRASKGIMVAAKPPSKRAKKMAEKHGIEICTAVDASHRNWSKDLAVPVLVNLHSGQVTPLLGISRPASGPPVEYTHGVTKFLISKDDGNSKLALLDFILQTMYLNQISEAGEYSFNFARDNVSVYVNKKYWWPLLELKIKLDISNKQLFRYCKPSEYTALKNHSSGKLSVTKLEFNFPALNNSKEWQDANNLDLATVKAELVPILNLKYSQFSETGAIGISVIEDKGA